jgi:hypothetical protein
MFRVLLIIVIAIFSNYIYSQSFYFGPAVGPGVNFQRWEESDNDPLISLNGDVFIESTAEETKSAFFAMLGYRTRGSSTIYNNTLNGISINSYKYKFNNAVLELGAKKFLSDDAKRAYYMVGIRGEYIINTNLKEYIAYQSPFFPAEAYVKKFVYGFSFGGGYDFMFNEFMGGFIQLSVSPDISLQYQQPPLRNVILPGPVGGNTINLPERRVKNTSIEIKFGLKLLRKVVYE